MKKRLLTIPALLFVSYYSFSQSVGIGTNTPDASAAMDITTTNKGLLIPRMSISSINAITNPARGLLVYDSVSNQLVANSGTPAVPNWQPVGSGNGWNLTGNSGINPVNQFIGTADNQPLRFRINNTGAGELNPVTGNIFWGLGAGQNNTTAFSNIAIGKDALKMNTTRANLVAIGDSALFNNGFGAAFSSNGVFNTAIGSKSLFSNILGSDNTATGNNSLTTNSGGSNNTATGSHSLFSNTNGSNNTSSGARSMQSNTNGSNNTSIGALSMQFNTTGGSNTVTGTVSFQLNTTGSNNTANGTGSLRFNTTGNNNTAVGNASLSDNSIGSNNTAVGASSLSRNSSSQFNTAVGFRAADGFDMGFNNTIIGADADVNQNGLFNCVALGQGATCTASSQVRLGNAATNSIGGVVGFSNLSDGRFKKNITEDVKGIDFVMRLRPVTYQMDITGINRKLNAGSDRKPDDRPEINMTENEKTIFSGFVAQEVEQAANDAGYDFSGVDKPKNEKDFYGLRYAEFVVPLVKAVQEQQQMINELKKQNAELQKRVLDMENARR